MTKSSVKRSSPKVANTNISLAEQAMANAGGVEQVGIDNLFQMVVNDDALLKQEMPQMVRRWCQSQIGAYLAMQRSKAWSPASVNLNTQRLNAAIKADLLDYPLPGGRRLGDASKAELQAASSYYSGIAQSNAWKARWLDEIGITMGNAHRVEDALSESDLQRLQDQTK